MENTTPPLISFPYPTMDSHFPLPYNSPTKEEVSYTLSPLPFHDAEDSSSDESYSSEETDLSSSYTTEEVPFSPPSLPPPLPTIGEAGSTKSPSHLKGPREGRSLIACNRCRRLKKKVGRPRFLIPIFGVNVVHLSANLPRVRGVNDVA